MHGAKQKRRCRPAASVFCILAPDVHCAVVQPAHMKLWRPSREAAVKSACRSWRCGAFPDSCGATLPYSPVDPIADAHGIQGRATKAAMVLQTAVGMGGS